METSCERAPTALHRSVGGAYAALQPIFAAILLFTSAALAQHSSGGGSSGGSSSSGGGTHSSSSGSSGGSSYSGGSASSHVSAAGGGHNAGGGSVPHSASTHVSNSTASTGRTIGDRSKANTVRTQDLRSIREPNSRTPSLATRHERPEKRTFFSRLRHVFRHPRAELRRPVCFRGPCAACPIGQTWHGGACAAAAFHFERNPCPSHELWSGGACLSAVAFSRRLQRPAHGPEARGNAHAQRGFGATKRLQCRSAPGVFRGDKHIPQRAKPVSLFAGSIPAMPATVVNRVSGSRARIFGVEVGSRQQRVV